MRHGKGHGVKGHPLELGDRIPPESVFPLAHEEIARARNAAGSGCSDPSEGRLRVRCGPTWDNVLNLVTAGFPRGETAGVGAPVFDRPVERPGGGPDASLRQRPIEFPDVAGAERGFERRARSSWSPSTITPLTSRSRRWTGSAEMPRRRSASGTVVPDAR
jgi:hypothetical protein